MRDRVLMEQMQAPPTRPQRRWLIVVLLIGLGSTLLLTTLAGNAQTSALLAGANLTFVALVIAAQMLRYIAMTISTRVVAHIVNMRVPFFSLLQATVSAQAANRTFVGGAAGFVIRLDFFLKRGMTGGTFTAVEAIEDGVSLIAVALIFLSGLAIVLASGSSTGFRWDVIGAFIVGVLVLAFLVISFLRRRAAVYRSADSIVRTVDRIFGRLLKRVLYHPERVRGMVDDFYRGLEFAQRDRGRVFISFLCAFSRLGCDALALYFSFHAIGYDVAPGAVLLIFIVSSSVSTIAAVPGQIGVMETMLSVMSTAFGIPPPVAVSATLLYRLVSFWLPVPFGYLFAWNLERKGQL
jgi:uncharacterized protein (TIRG00374 family)